MEFAGQVTLEPTLSLGSPSDLKEQVKQAVDIVDLVGSYVQLRRQGRNYVALCPWHDDSRPSLQVNPERQSFKCWVCDIGGDVFSFVMQMEGIAFPEALKMLADRAGITITPQRPRHSHGHAHEHDEHDEAAPAGPDKHTLYRVMAWAERQYHDCLLNQPEGEAGRQYLAERGITSESIEQWHLGFSPEAWDWILRRAENKGPSLRLLEAVGIAVRSAGTGRAYDRFRGRVLFSIRDVQNRAIALGGRVLPQNAANQPAKYVNSPETPLFRKSNQLYGLDVARDAIRKSHTAVVMEGYTDCIIAHQYGFNNTVAVLGTALGEGHLRILKRFCDRVLLVLDGDEAGQKRANEVLELFVAQQADLRIVTLPKEKDPCDFLLKRGAEEFRELLESHAVDAIEHAFRVATRGIDLDRDVHAATAALERLIGIIAKAPRQRDDTTREDRLREEKILQRLAASFRIDEREIRNQVTELRRKARPAGPSRVPEHEAPPAEERKAVQPDVWERELLELLVRCPELVPQAAAAVTFEQLQGTWSRRIYETSCRLAAAGVLPDFQRLMLEFDHPAIKKLLVDLDEQGHAKGSRVADPAALLQELIRSFENREVRKRRPAETAALREGQMAESEEIDLLRQILQREQARHGSSKPTEG